MWAIAAMRESGFDPSFRFGPFDGSTHHYAPVCLNSLLYRYEKRPGAHRASAGKGRTDAARWEQARARCGMRRSSAICGGRKKACLRTTISCTRKPSSYAYISSLYPLWAGEATREEAKQVVAEAESL